MCSYMWTCCQHARGRFECTNGGVFESTHGFFHIFQRATTHTNTHKHTHTHQTHTTTTNNTTTTTTHHTTSHGDCGEVEDVVGALTPVVGGVAQVFHDLLVELRLLLVAEEEEGEEEDRQEENWEIESGIGRIKKRQPLTCTAWRWVT